MTYNVSSGTLSLYTTTTKTRQCETETKNYETETSPVKSVASESNTYLYVSFFNYTQEVNDQPEMDFACKMITE